MIHRLRVENFKSIRDVTVDLSPVTVLVGKSGTGKSNFVNSLRFLRDMLSSSAQVHAAQQEWAQSRPATNHEAATRFEVEYSIAGVSEIFRYTLAVSLHGPQLPPLEERLDLGSKCLFRQGSAGPRNPHESKWLIEPDVVPLPQSGPPALGRIPAITEIVIAYTALTSGIGCYAFPDDVLTGNSTHPTIGLDDRATSYLEVLKEIVRNLQDLSVRRKTIGAIQRLNPSVSSVELDDIQNPTGVVVGHRFNEKTLALRLYQESDGFRRFYAHMLALYQRPPKQTLVFEHPEDGIHPGALAVLAEEFQSAPLEGRGQVVLTTHSPRLLDHFEADQIRVVELAGFETKIGPVSREQREAIQDRLLDAGDLLTVDPARIDAREPETAPA
jgi:predicted ATPase